MWMAGAVILVCVLSLSRSMMMMTKMHLFARLYCVLSMCL